MKARKTRNVNDVPLLEWFFTSTEKQQALVLKMHRDFSASFGVDAVTAIRTIHALCVTAKDAAK